MLRAEPLPSEGRSDCPAACSPSRTACASTASTRSSNRACSRRQTASRVSHPAASARSMEPTEPADALNSVRQRQQPHMRRVPCPSRQAWCSARQQSGTALQCDGMMLRNKLRGAVGASKHQAVGSRPTLACRVARIARASMSRVAHDTFFALEAATHVALFASFMNSYLQQTTDNTQRTRHDPHCSLHGASVMTSVSNAAWAHSIRADHKAHKERSCITMRE